MDYFLQLFTAFLCMCLKFFPQILYTQNISLSETDCIHSLIAEDGGKTGRWNLNLITIRVHGDNQQPAGV